MKLIRTTIYVDEGGEEELFEVVLEDDIAVLAVGNQTIRMDVSNLRDTCKEILRLIYEQDEN